MSTPIETYLNRAQDPDTNFLDVTFPPQSSVHIGDLVLTTAPQTPIYSPLPYKTSFNAEWILPATSAGVEPSRKLAQASEKAIVAEKIVPEEIKSKDVQADDSSASLRTAEQASAELDQKTELIGAFRFSGTNFQVKDLSDEAGAAISRIPESVDEIVHFGSDPLYVPTLLQSRLDVRRDTVEESHLPEQSTQPTKKRLTGIFAPSKKTRQPETPQSDKSISSIPVTTKSKRSFFKRLISAEPRSSNTNPRTEARSNSKSNLQIPALLSVAEEKVTDDESPFVNKDGTIPLEQPQRRDFQLATNEGEQEAQSHTTNQQQASQVHEVSDIRSVPHKRVYPSQPADNPFESRSSGISPITFTSRSSAHRDSPATHSTVSNASPATIMSSSSYAEGDIPARAPYTAPNYSPAWPVEPIGQQAR